MEQVAARLLNATIGLLCAWAIAAWLAHVLRARPAWAKAALLLPFVKSVAVLAAGLAAGAFAHSAYFGSRLDQGRFQLGVGVQQLLLPMFNGFLEARVAEAWFPMSGGELVVNAIARRVGFGWVHAAVWFALAIGALRVLLRIFVAARFERARRAERRNALTLDRIQLRFRSVDLYLAPARNGAPFTGGTFHPYVCIPGDSARPPAAASSPEPEHKASPSQREAVSLAGSVPSAVPAGLTDAEREAALQHELAHARAFDPALFMAIELVADLLWFVPGVRYLVAALRAAAERAADRAAVARGADPVQLASALLRFAEVPTAEPSGAIALTRPRSRTADRIHSLLAPPAPAEKRWQLALRLAFAIALAHAALLSRFIN